jgi:hypothetical protein
VLLVCISLEIEISICLIILEFLDIVQSQPLPDVPAENPALFSSEKTGWYTESLLLSRRQNVKVIQSCQLVLEFISNKSHRITQNP